jgi:hypothetical protein
VSAPAPDPLTVACPRCDEPPGNRCGTINDYSRRPHAARVKLALALAAHADPALDAFFPMLNPCALCGSGLPQRHRMVNAIAGALQAGETAQDIMAELEVSLDAVMAVTAWAQRWPGAWR